MTKKLKSILLTLATVAFAGAPTVLVTSSVAAASPDIQGTLCAGSNFDISGNSGSCPTTGTSNLNSLLTKIINIFSAVVGVIAVIMIIVGGLRYITSGGDTGKVSAAKTTIIYALVGLVVVALAQLVVHFVLSQSAGVAQGG